MKSWLSLENGWQIHLDTQTRAQEITLWSCNCGVFHAWQQRFLRVLQMAQNDLLKSCRAAGFSIKMGRVWMRSSTSSVFYLSYLHICVQPSQLTKSLKKTTKKKTKQHSIQFTLVSFLSLNFSRIPTWLQLFQSWWIQMERLQPGCEVKAEACASAADACS